MSYFHKFVKFSKAMFTVLPKIFALAPTNRRFAEKNRLSGDTAAQCCIILTYLSATIISFCFFLFTAIMQNIDPYW